MNHKTWQIISDKKLWDNSLAANPAGNFLQSFSFGDFHEKLGNKVWRLGILDSERILSFAQVIKIKTKLGSFLYLPWGPILERSEEIESLLEELRQISNKEETAFVRLEPRVEITNWQNYNLKPSSSYTQPNCSLFLDLTKSLDELKKDLSESTRYNIGWVERKGVKVEISNDLNEIEIFLDLLKETASRQGFNLHQNADYNRKQFLSFAQNNFAKLFITRAPAELGGQPLAGAIVIYFGDTVTYLHAASSSQQQKLRASYLMQWKIIEDAKNLGAKKYDFWGVAPTDKTNEDWAGVTAFKKSFGGERVFYPKPFDLVVSNKYYLMTLVEKIRPAVRLLRR